MLQKSSVHASRWSFFTGSSCMSQQNRDSSLHTTFCHSTSQCCRSLHQLRRWRLRFAVKGSNNIGRYDKSPKTRMRQSRVYLLKGIDPKFRVVRLGWPIGLLRIHLSSSFHTRHTCITMSKLLRLWYCCVLFDSWYFVILSNK